ncbi:MAG: ABC transporter ATP-binding protein [Rhodocyclaceae bacterium]|nr:ABC transporter ATP-binding protein [Rhodocyclaceae bacterium]MBP7080790.1 ABC transporter ATP-binding protein [Rhodocyclaceae bacterium]
MNSTPLLSVRDLRVNFRMDKHTNFEALKGVSFDIPREQTVALVGESGSGKSVSSLAIMGLLPKENATVDPRSQVLYGGRDLLRLSGDEMRQLRGKEISMIFQDPMSSLNPVLSIGNQLNEILMLHMGLSARQAQERSIALLEEVGLPEPSRRINRYPFELSGGQQQRVMIAMAMACEPKLLIADEPTTALDVTIQKQIIELVDALRRKHGMAVLWISHDLAVVGEIADRVIVMRHGEIREEGTTRQIFESAKDRYTQALIQCRPPLDHRPLRLAVIDDFMADGTIMDSSKEEAVRGLSPNDEIVLEVKGLNKEFVSREGLFGKRVLRAVKDVSFTLPRGKTVGLVGESGSGKTTVGLTIMRLHEASSGEVLFMGQDLLKMSKKEQMPFKRRIQIIFQNPYASLNPRFVVGDILMEPMRIHGIGANDAEREKLARQLLERVGMPATSFGKYPHEFSGGQRQRVAVARALSMKPDVLICDESVSALDVSVQAQVLNMLQDLQEEFQMSYIFISHDLAVVKYISDEVIVMNQGEVVEIADSDEIYRNPQHAYTKKLLGSIPRGWHAH